jgi:predicted nicotinamide N-methyase
MVYLPLNREQLRTDHPTWWWMYTWGAGILLSHEIMQFPQPKQILEIGCGLGLASTVASKLGHDISCTDLVEETEWYVNQTAQLAGTNVPTWKLPTDVSGTFEMIMFSDVLYAHFKNPIPFLESLITHLAPDGTILCVEPHRPEVLTPVLDVLPAVGLEVVSSTYLDRPIGSDGPWEETTYVKLQIQRK